MPVPRFSEKFYRDFYSSFAPQFFNKMVSLSLCLMYRKRLNGRKMQGPARKRKVEKALAPHMRLYHARTRPLKRETNRKILVPLEHAKAPWFQFESCSVPYAFENVPIFREASKPWNIVAFIQPFRCFFCVPGFQSGCKVDVR